MFDALLEFLKHLKPYNPDRGTIPAPDWSRKRARARPFGSKRKREAGPQRMHVEEFADKDARDARFRELRDRGTRNVSKFSTYNGHRSVWCVVRP